MQKVWNYLLYSTWRLLCISSKILIEQPLNRALSIVPFFRKNIQKGKKEHRKIMDDRDFSFNIAFAFGYMFFTTMIIYVVIFMYLGYFLHIEVGDNLLYYFIAVVALSYLTNQILSWRKDLYLKYFNEFDKVNNKSQIYLHAVLFHLGIFLFAVLSIYWMVGFNF